MFKLLIVDDELLERNAIEYVVRGSDLPIVEIRQAASGRQAIGVAAGFAPDIVLMDIKMPGVNGIEAAKSIRAALPGCRIVFLSAFSNFEYAREALRLGADDFIVKPADDGQVVGTLREAIRVLQAERDRRSEQADRVRRLLIAAAQLEDGPPGPPPPAGRRAAGGPAPGGDPEPDPGSGPEDRAGREGLPDRTVALVQRACRYIEAHYREDICLDELARLTGFSSFYLSRVFKQQRGVSFTDYLTAIRIERAKELLRDPTANVKEVSCLAGYADPNYFTRVFKRVVGVTPTDYRDAAAPGD